LSNIEAKQVQEEMKLLRSLSINIDMCIDDLSNDIHAQLGHPRLAKLQKTVSSLKHLSTLNCKSCQFGNHVRQSFHDSLNK